MDHTDRLCRHTPDARANSGSYKVIQQSVSQLANGSRLDLQKFNLRGSRLASSRAECETAAGTYRLAYTPTEACFELSRLSQRAGFH